MSFDPNNPFADVGSSEWSFDEPVPPAAAPAGRLASARDRAGDIAGQAARRAGDFVGDPEVQRLAKSIGGKAVEGALEGSGVVKKRRDGTKKVSLFGAARAVMDPGRAARRAAIGGARAGVTAAFNEVPSAVAAARTPAIEAAPPAQLSNQDIWAAPPSQGFSFDEHLDASPSSGFDSAPQAHGDPFSFDAPPASVQQPQQPAANHPFSFDDM